MAVRLALWRLGYVCVYPGDYLPSPEGLAVVKRSLEAARPTRLGEIVIAALRVVGRGLRP